MGSVFRIITAPWYMYDYLFYCISVFKIDITRQGKVKKVRQRSKDFRKVLLVVP